MTWNFLRKRIDLKKIKPNKSHFEAFILRLINNFTTKWNLHWLCIRIIKLRVEARVSAST